MDALLAIFAMIFQFALYGAFLAFLIWIYVGYYKYLKLIGHPMPWMIILLGTVVLNDTVPAEADGQMTVFGNFRVPKMVWNFFPMIAAVLACCFPVALAMVYLPMFKFSYDAICNLEGHNGMPDTTKKAVLHCLFSVVIPWKVFKFDYGHELRPYSGMFGPK